ncbi:hypothetical protein G6F65_015751 [Rhizopus arrhizus]|nr:hypothetical protein G6F65_015751 [Rhizopus arrhizus]
MQHLRDRTQHGGRRAVGAERFAVDHPAVFDHGGERAPMRQRRVAGAGRCAGDFGHAESFTGDLCRVTAQTLNKTRIMARKPGAPADQFGITT